MGAQVAQICIWGKLYNGGKGNRYYGVFLTLYSLVIPSLESEKSSNEFMNTAINDPRRDLYQYVGLPGTQLKVKAVQQPGAMLPAGIYYIASKSHQSWEAVCHP